MRNEVERVRVSVAENDRLEKEGFMVFDLCFGWVPIEHLLMGDEEVTSGIVRAEPPLPGD